MQQFGDLGLERLGLGLRRGIGGHGAGLTLIGLTLIGLTLIGLTLIGLTLIGLTLIGLTLIGLTLIGLTLIGLTLIGLAGGQGSRLAGCQVRENGRNPDIARLFRVASFPASRFSGFTTAVGAPDFAGLA
jgi:hypothetical protein